MPLDRNCKTCANRHPIYGCIVLLGFDGKAMTAVLDWGTRVGIKVDRLRLSEETPSLPEACPHWGQGYHVFAEE
jgi:hypothetical protein